MASDASTRQLAAQTLQSCCSVVELRQYTTVPGRRDDLIALFEAYLIEDQERRGMRLIGQFRDRNNPDRFVWIRGFADMETRRDALEGFYSGPIWREHRVRANDTMLDSSNVMLLRPANSASSFQLDPTARPPIDAPETDGDIVIATIYHFNAPVDARFSGFFEAGVVPALRAAGAVLRGYFVTEPGENTFPLLPVREHERVFVWFATFASDATYTAYRAALSTSRVWITSLAPALAGWLSQPAEILDLTPTRRSLLRHRPAGEALPTSHWPTS